MMTADFPLEVAEFLSELRRQEASPATVRNYGADLRAFARWFPDSTGEVFAAKAVTPTDLRAAYTAATARSQLRQSPLKNNDK